MNIFEDLFEELKEKGKIMDSLEITGLHLFGVDQSELVNYLLNNVKKLTLDEGERGGMLNSELFIKTLSQISVDSKLQHLTLGIFDESNPQDFADAVCQVQVSIYLFYQPTVKRKQLGDSSKIFKHRTSG